MPYSTKIQFETICFSNYNFVFAPSFTSLFYLTLMCFPYFHMEEALNKYWDKFLQKTFVKLSIRSLKTLCININRKYNPKAAFSLLFSHLADAFIQSDVQIRKSN